MMSKLFFVLSLLLASNAFAATGTGHSQAELTQPLTVTELNPVNLGTIAIDPGAGPQTISIGTGGPTVACPATYICPGGQPGNIRVQGAVYAFVDINIGATAILSDGAGSSLVFEPFTWWSGGPVNAVSRQLSSIGVVELAIGGSIDFTGSEIAGTYSSSNAGGSGYTITVNY